MNKIVRWPTLLYFAISVLLFACKPSDNKAEDEKLPDTDTKDQDKGKASSWTTDSELILSDRTDGSRYSSNHNAPGAMSVTEWAAGKVGGNFSMTLHENNAITTARKKEVEGGVSIR